MHSTVVVLEELADRNDITSEHEFVVPLETTMSREEMLEIMKSMMRVILKHRKPFSITISNWNADSRALFEIPEAVQYFRMLMDIGFISLLAVKPWSACLLGAVHVCAFATGQVKVDGTHFETTVDPDEFRRVLGQARLTCERLCAEDLV